MVFQFRLTTLQKLREQTRDERRSDLAQAYEAERILRDRAKELQLEFESNRERLRGLAQRRELQVDSLTDARRYEALLNRSTAELQQQIADVAQEVERRRLALLEADREVKVLEKLRERQLTAYEAVQSKREDQRLDEAALRGFNRQREAAQ